MFIIKNEYYDSFNNWSLIVCQTHISINKSLERDFMQMMIGHSKKKKKEVKNNKKYVEQWMITPPNFYLFLFEFLLFL